MKIKDLSLPIDGLFPNNLSPDKHGLVALGGTLSTFVLIEAYSKGIFPWAGNHPIPWYSPDPRLVLFPKEFHLSGSMKKVLKKKNFHVFFDQNFKDVITRCAEIKRAHQDGTWIDNQIIDAYTELFHHGIAHCVEVHMDGELAGGLYGLSLGNIFFGESMFANRSNASKIALYHLTQKLISLNFSMIDCQQSTKHMLSLGAREISRNEFLKCIEQSNKLGINIIKW